jgi:serine phosphatase RsbU (regulator of sigma subunit)
MKFFRFKYSIFLLLLLCSCFSIAQNKKIDSLISYIKSVKEDTNQINALIELSKQYRSLSKHDDALQYAQQAHRLGEKLLNAGATVAVVNTLKKNIALAFQIIGSIYSDKGNYAEALDYFSKALALRKEINNKQGIASSLNNMGIVYWKQGSFVKALDSYFTALPIAEEINHKQLMALLYNNIGIIYKAQGNLIKGLNYYTKALKIREELNDKQGIAASLDNISIIYIEQKKFTLALEELHKSLTILTELDDKEGMANVYNNIGLTFENQKDYKPALDYYLKSLALREEINDKRGISVSLINIGLIYLEQKNYPFARQYSTKCLEIAKETGALELCKDAYQALYEIAEKTGDTKLALDYFKNFINARDSLLSKENNEKSLRAEMNFEFEKKEAVKKAEQEKKDEIQAEKNHKQTILIWAISGILILVLIFAVLIWRNNLQKQKANQALDEKQKEILDSIQYAQRIQKAMLTSETYFDSHLKNYFILYKPKDIVSGDFYWAVENKNKFYIVTGDCTGHGVPGAFMSLINISILNEIIVEREIERPDLILNDARTSIIRALNTDNNTNSKDGMDCVLSCFDFKNKTLEYAAANNSFYIIREKQLIVCKADKMHVGMGERKDPFSYNKIELKENDIVYTFTDGYVDQFGGDKGKKFKSRQLEELLLSICNLSPEEQKDILAQKFEDWKGNLEQVDDVLIIGVKI